VPRARRKGSGSRPDPGPLPPTRHAPRARARALPWAPPPSCVSPRVAMLPGPPSPALLRLEGKSPTPPIKCANLAPACAHTAAAHRCHPPDAIRAATWSSTFRAISCWSELLNTTHDTPSASHIVCCLGRASVSPEQPLQRLPPPGSTAQAHRRRPSPVSGPQIHPWWAPSHAPSLTQPFSPLASPESGQPPPATCLRTQLQGSNSFRGGCVN
jgi:hypothetical protein